MAIVTPYTYLRALVIDDQAIQQSTLRSNLNLLGIGRVDGASSPDSALKLIRRSDYHLVLCDYNLDSRTDGQQLLEHLRTNGDLAPDTLFFMITAEGSYAAVAAASELHPDAYLLKPVTAAEIAERLKAALERRAAVLPVMQALRDRDLERAVVECDQAIARVSRYRLYALQLKASTQLRMGRFEDARATFEEALTVRPGLVWARLGIARAAQGRGRHEEAISRAKEIVRTREGSRALAAYEVMATSLEARGDGRGAVVMLRQAAEQVPSPKRHRALGEAAYRQGDLEMAHTSMARVKAATRGAMTAQTSDALLLAQVCVDLGETEEALTVLADKDYAALNDQHDPASAVAAAIQAQALVAKGDLVAARAACDRAAASLLEAGPDFATVALARAEIATGREAAGLERLRQAMASDHENARFRQLAQTALERSGHADKVASVIDGAAAKMKASIDSARAELRAGDALKALAEIEGTLARAPNNTGVLLEATQIACMALRLTQQLDDDLLSRAQTYAARLERLLPGSDRVARMQHYLRETVASLESAAVSADAQQAPA